jgi:alpha-L-arabinofuranosidase
MALTRRDVLAAGAGLAGSCAALAEVQRQGPGLVLLDPTPRFRISPRLYMQFMEPLGATDGSVAASWDDEADDWRADFVATVRDLAPDVIRWGGLFSRYYRWFEGVGPRDSRPPMRNHVWGGWEMNRVGTAEVVDLCRRTGAEPLLVVNFLSDGHRRYAATREGNRTGDAEEAADWVSYCNDPDHAVRRAHGARAPFGVKLWQIGNETNYGPGGFSKREAIDQTIAFAKAMRARDPSIELIGWGDRGYRPDAPLWAPDMLREAGEHLDLIAIHMMQQIPPRPDTVLKGRAYADEPARAWAELLEMSDAIEARLAEVEEVLAAGGFKTGLAVTEGHLSLQPHNSNPILTEWLTGVYHARALNLYQRRGDRVRMATIADFNSTRWTVAAVRLLAPWRTSYLLPAGAVMRLFKRHKGEDAISVRSSPSDLDIAASRTGNRLFLHVANLRLDRSVEATFAAEGRAISAGRALSIAPDPRTQAWEETVEAFRPREIPLGPGPSFGYRFPAASVSVVELALADRSPAP